MYIFQLEHIPLLIELFCAGVILRDSHGVAQVRFVTGNQILRILKAKGLAPAIPEDLYCLIKKAVAIRKHLERNRKVSNGASGPSWGPHTSGLSGVCMVGVYAQLDFIAWLSSYYTDFSIGRSGWYAIDVLCNVPVFE